MSVEASEIKCKMRKLAGPLCKAKIMLIRSKSFPQLPPVKHVLCESCEVSEVIRYGENYTRDNL